MSTPDWLARHDGSMKLAPDGRTWLAFFDGEPHYKLLPAPAKGGFTCRVCQMENGKCVDKGQTYPTADDALRGGLEELRVFLGW
jgi:hypothetical protein